MQNQNNTNPMETGSIPKLLAQLAIPAVVAQVINLLYNIVDRIYIGHIPGIGAAALTGVGLFAPILMLLNAFAMLVGSGGAPRAAIAMGKKDHDTAEKIVGNCFTLLTGLAVILTILFYISAPTLLKLFGASSATMSYATAYARIYILGSFFVLIVLGMNPFITTQGFAKISMMTTVIGAVINIILDPVFIFVLGMGVRGAALATVLSQAVGAIWILRFLTGKKTILRLTKENMRLEVRVFGPCLALGISTFVMLSTESLLSISFTNSLSRYGGDVAVGAMTIITSINQLVAMPVQGICQGGQPIISYNYGARRPRRVKKAGIVMGLMIFCYTAIMWSLILVAPGMLIRVFSSDNALIRDSIPMLKLYFAAFIFMDLQYIGQTIFKSLNKKKQAIFFSLLRKVFIVVPLTYLLPYTFHIGTAGVFIAEPVSNVMGGAICFITMLCTVLPELKRMENN